MFISINKEQTIINNYSKTTIIVQERKKYISTNNQDILNKKRINLMNLDLCIT